VVITDEGPQEFQQPPAEFLQVGSESGSESGSELGSEISEFESSSLKTFGGVSSQLTRTEPGKKEEVELKIVKQLKVPMLPPGNMAQHMGCFTKTYNKQFDKGELKECNQDGKEECMKMAKEAGLPFFAITVQSGKRL
jgi:hypothetical protein